MLKMETNHILCFFLLFTTFLKLVSSRPAPSKICHLFLFGDQYFDVGNNNYIQTIAQANYLPYGEKLGKTSGRFSDGRLIGDFIAEYMGLPLIHPYLEGNTSDIVNHGANFASALSGALPETYQDLFPTIPLPTQLSNFQNMTTMLRKTLGKKKAKKVISNAIYLFSVGSNDYLAPYVPYGGQFPGRFPYYPSEFVGRVIENVVNVTQEIYNLGGRKFGFLNNGPLGCYPYIFPMTLSTGCVEQANDLASMHNMELSTALDHMQKDNLGFRYAIHNTYDSITARMNNPSQYGYNDGRTACCGSEMNNGDLTCGGRGGNWDYNLCDNSDVYMFFDGLDYTEKANKEVAQLFWNGTMGVSNLQSLLV